MTPFQNPTVEAKYNSYPDKARKKLLQLRQLILETASTTEGVGLIEEALKWGEPSFLTSQTKSGSTIRVDWKKQTPNQYGLYFNCKTTLVDTFKEMFGNTFRYEGNRAIIFELDEKIPLSELRHCIAMALRYQLDKSK